MNIDSPLRYLTHTEFIDALTLPDGAGVNGRAITIYISIYHPGQYLILGVEDRIYNVNKDRHSQFQKYVGFCDDFLFLLLLLHAGVAGSKIV